MRAARQVRLSNTGILNIIGESNILLFTFATITGISTYQCAVHHLPNATNTLDTTYDTDRTSIKIYRNDPAPTTYIVGVHSMAYYSAYQISAAFQESTLDLQAGVPVMDHVNKGEKDYFSFYLDQSFVSVTFALTTVSFQLWLKVIN